jgi:hypothetical protein
VGKKKEAFFH